MYFTKVLPLCLLLSCPSAQAQDIVWQQIESNHRVHALAIDAQGRLYAGVGHGSILRSDDDGASWKLMTMIEGTSIKSLTVTPDGRLYTGALDYSGENGGLYRSDDHGVSWTRIDSSFDVEVMLYVGQDTLLIGNSSELFRTTDGGEHWEHVLSTIRDFSWFKTLMGVSGGSIYAAAGGCQEASCGEVYRSLDRGKTWTLVYDTGSEPTILSRNPETGRILLGTYDLVRWTEDGGQTWSLNLDANPGPIYDMEHAGGTVFYAATSVGILRSPDDGRTWEPVGLSDPILNTLAIDAHGRLLVGTSDGIYRSDMPVVSSREPGYGQGSGILAWHSAYPNPSREEPAIHFELNAPSQVRIEMYDLLGRSRGVLVDAHLPAGNHRVRWQIGGLAMGTYVYRLWAQDAMWSGLITIVK